MCVRKEGMKVAGGNGRRQRQEAVAGVSGRR